MSKFYSSVCNAIFIRPLLFSLLLAINGKNMFATENARIMQRITQLSKKYPVATPHYNEGFNRNLVLCNTQNGIIPGKTEMLVRRVKYDSWFGNYLLHFFLKSSFNSILEKDENDKDLVCLKDKMQVLMNSFSNSIRLDFNLHEFYELFKINSNYPQYAHNAKDFCTMMNKRIVYIDSNDQWNGHQYVGYTSDNKPILIKIDKENETIKFIAADNKLTLMENGVHLINWQKMYHLDYPHANEIDSSLPIPEGLTIDQLILNSGSNYGAYFAYINEMNQLVTRFCNNDVIHSLDPDFINSNDKILNAIFIPNTTLMAISMLSSKVLLLDLIDDTVKLKFQVDKSEVLKIHHLYNNKTNAIFTPLEGGSNLTYVWDPRLFNLPSQIEKLNTEKLGELDKVLNSIEQNPELLTKAEFDLIEKSKYAEILIKPRKMMNEEANRILIWNKIINVAYSKD